MKIAVLIKQVPDTETKIKINGDASGIDEADVKFIVSPYCEFAVEEALRTKEKAGDVEVTVISLGSERTIEAIRTALAMGVDKGIHIDSEGQTFDSFMTAKAIATVLKDGGYDLIFCGKQAVDGDNSQTGPMIAEFMDIPQVMVIEKSELQEGNQSITLTRRVSGGIKEIYDVDLPVIVGCETGLNKPRYASLPGIMKAKSKPVEKLKAQDLIGGEAPKVQFVQYQLPADKEAGRKIDGEPEDQAKELVRLLRAEAKVL